MPHCSRKRPGVFVPLNTSTIHIGRNINGYLEKYPPCTFQTQRGGEELRKFQVLGSGKIFRANFFFHTATPPPPKAARRYQEFFFLPPPPPGLGWGGGC